MTLPAQDIVERLREPEFVTTNTGRLAADLIESQAATISRLTADNEALRRDNARLSEEKDALAFGMRHGQSLAEDAIHAIRELLNEAGVPLAAFVDDHVGNAIVQRNQERARADALAQEVERLRQERDELQAVFDLRWEADMRAISKWRDAGPGRELTLPDHVDLVIFLFEWVEELLVALEPFARFAEKAERFVQGRADFGGSPIMPTKHFRLADFRRARAALGGRP